MMNDDRDRREQAGETPESRPEADELEQGRPGDQAWPPGGEPAEAEQVEPEADAASGETTAAAEEFEAPPASETTPASWPEADRGAAAWPTEPPAAGSGDVDTWPTSAPERDAEALAWDAERPVPEEGERGVDEAPQATLPPPEAEAYEAPAAAAAATPAHAVPAATEVGESTQCPRCGTENRPGLAFCRNCGQRLVAAGVGPTLERPGTPEGTMACPRCGTHNRAGVAFCQNCGANLRATATPGYVPPAAEAAGEPATATVEERARAILGPIVLLIGAAGIVAGWLLPFPYGSGTSLYDRAFGPGGYGAGFWSGYPDVTGGIADQAYFGFAAPAPVLAVLLLLLAIGGMARARPGVLQSIGLALALIWAIGLAVLFVLVEVLGNAGGPITELLRALTPGGIIFFLASLIVLIGTLTRFARS